MTEQRQKEVFTFSIKKELFDAILSGNTTEVTKYIRSRTTEKRLLKGYAVCDRYKIGLPDFEKNGKFYESQQEADKVGTENDLLFRAIAYKPKYLKLLTGAYNIRPRPYCIVEVLGVDTTASYDNEKMRFDTIKEENGYEFIAQIVTYELGEIVEVRNNK